NFALVDPDNRRSVDYELRARLLSELPDLERRLSEGRVADPFDPRLKLLLTQRLLRFRRSNPALFARGSYERLSVRGPSARRVVAFARTLDQKQSITIVGRHAGPQEQEQDSLSWLDTVVLLPPNSESIAWRSCLLEFD